MKPSITILLASYNRLSFLQESVASCLQQSGDDFDVLIVDDGSGEETREWLRTIQSDRVSVVFQENKGVAVARQRGLEEAKGKYICILDSDDSLVPDALKEMRLAMNRTPEVSIYYTNNREIYPGGGKKRSQYKQFDNPQDFLWAFMIMPRVPFKHSGTLFKRDVALSMGGYDTSLPCKIDIDFMLKFLANDYLPILIETPLVNFNFHSDSISRNRWLGIRCWVRIICRYIPCYLVHRRVVALFCRIGFEMTKWGYERVFLARNTMLSGEGSNRC